MNCFFYWYENVVFPAQAAECSYFSVDFRLKIFLNWVIAYGIFTLECFNCQCSVSRFVLHFFYEKE